MVVVGVLAGCGDVVEQTERAVSWSQPAGAVRLDDAVVGSGDLVSGPPFREWRSVAVPSESDGDEPDRERVDRALTACGDPAEFDAPRVNSVGVVRSLDFWSSTESITRLSVLVRGFAFDYADEDAAQRAFDSYTEDTFSDCVARSVTTDAADEVGALNADPLGEGHKVFSTGLDTFGYFEGNDDATTFRVHVQSAGTVVSVSQFVVSGQYFKDVAGDLDGLEQDVTAAVWDRLAAD